MFLTYCGKLSWLPGSVLQESGVISSCPGRLDFLKRFEKDNRAAIYERTRPPDYLSFELTSRKEVKVHRRTWEIQLGYLNTGEWSQWKTREESCPSSSTFHKKKWWHTHCIFTSIKERSGRANSQIRSFSSFGNWAKQVNLVAMTAQASVFISNERLTIWSR